MNNKEELIKWMTEKRESLTFESKVSLIWEYWENRNTIPTLRKEVENLKKDVASWQVAREIVMEQKRELDKKLLERDNRIAQLSKTIEVGKALLQHQIEYLKNLATRLEKEQEKNTDNQDYQAHLREDIKRLTKERQELDKSLKELTEQERINKELRDQEIADLRKEIEDMKPKYLSNEEMKIKSAFHSWFNKGIETSVKVDKFREELKKYDLKSTNRVFGNMPLSVNNALNALYTKLIKLEKAEGELVKEKDWWDKWIADNDLSSSSHSTFANFVYQKTGKDFTFRISISNLMLDYGITNDVSLTDAKKMVKAIAEWYKNKTE